LLAAFTDLEPVVDRGVTDLFLKEGAEGADAFETYLVANFSYGKIVAGQAFPGLFHPFTGQVLVRGQLVDPGEKPVEMVSGKTGFPGKAFQVDRRHEILVDIQLCRHDLFIDVGSDWHSSNFNGTLFALTRYKFSNFDPCPKKATGLKGLLDH
jgi:hypothetical protein